MENLNTRPSHSKYLMLGAGIAILVFGGIWTSLQIRQATEPPGMAISMNTEATVLTEPMDIPEFSLTDHRGQTFTDKDLQGRWSFLFFGYTHCPDVCPTALATLNQVDKLLHNKTAVRPQTVFISVDPERDKIDHLAEYVSYFNPGFLGVTGAETQIQALSRPLGIAFWRAPEQDNTADYLIDHSASILLVNPDSQLQALISPPHNPKTVAKDFQMIVEAFERK